MKIEFIKIPKYNLYPFDNTRDNFKFVCQLLNQEINPPSSKKMALDIKSEIILSSQLKRARECINAPKKSKIIYLPELNEIKIDIQNMCNLEDWEKIGSSIIRKKFKEAFIKDALEISRKQIYQQYQKIFEYIKDKKSVTIVSHTFRLILIKAIYETKGEIIENPQLIHDYIKDDKKVLNFEEKFFMDIKKPS